MTIDLTSTVQNSSTPQVVSPQKKGTTENLRVPNNPAAKEFRKGHWTIDKAAEDGQIKAGKVDEEHKKFLEETEFVD